MALKAWQIGCGLLALGALTGCYRIHERDAAAPPPVVIDSGVDSAIDTSMDTIDSGVDARDTGPDILDRDRDRTLLTWEHDHCAKTGDELWGWPSEMFPCVHDTDCATGGCGGEVCFDRRGLEGGATCECGSPVSAGCGCVHGRCAWYDMRPGAGNPDAPCSESGESCIDQLCCAPSRCYFATCS
jgi:hypothetical protein